MKVEDVQMVYDGAVRGEKKVAISATKEETDELRKALAIVDRFEKMALQAAKYNKNGADWVMLRYAVKTDKVTITVEEGACG